MGHGWDANEQWIRQMSIPGFGPELQSRLASSRVTVFGVGGVGCAAALYLAAAGVGRLILVDRDTISPSNLNRQVIYTWADIGLPKALTAAAKLRQLNPCLQVEAVGRDVGMAEIAGLIEGTSFVVEAFDSTRARLAVNEACVRSGVAAVHGFARDLSGELIVVEPKKTACLACALDENFPEEDECPVLGATAGIVGVYAALAAVKYITGIGPASGGRRIIFDLLLDRFMKVELVRQPSCPICREAGA